MANDDIEVDTSNVTRYPPGTDIDEYIEDCDFCIERLDEDGVWVAAITHDDDEPDYHYNISCRDDGLHIRHREEE